MKTPFLLITGAALLLAGGRPAVAQDSNPDSRPDFNSFQVIDQNNIFNPYRQPPRGPRGPTGPIHRTYYFTLNGAITYENKAYAFFDGNGVNRGGVFSPSDTINGYKIAEISSNTVKLAASSNQFITLKVGMQMRREDNGPWKLVASSIPSAEYNASGSGSSDSAQSSDDSAGAGADASAPTPMIPGADSEVIKRLMRKRAEENGDTNSATSNGDQNQ